MRGIRAGRPRVGLWVHARRGRGRGVECRDQIAEHASGHVLHPRRVGSLEVFPAGEPAGIRRGAYRIPGRPEPPACQHHALCVPIASHPVGESRTGEAGETRAMRSTGRARGPGNFPRGMPLMQGDVNNAGPSWWAWGHLPLSPGRVQVAARASRRAIVRSNMSTRSAGRERIAPFDFPRAAAATPAASPGCA
jgi:hypothetical protein